MRNLKVKIAIFGIMQDLSGKKSQNDIEKWLETKMLELYSRK